MPVLTRSNTAKHQRRVRFGDNVSPSDVSQDKQHNDEHEKKKHVIWTSKELDALDRAERAGVKITVKGITESGNEDVMKLLQGCLREDGYKRTANAIYAKSKAMKKKEKPPVAPPLTSAKPEQSTVVDGDMMPNQEAQEALEESQSLEESP